jgi:hypothetical protein
MKQFLILSLAIILSGCGATHGIDIREQTTNFTPPVIQGNVQAHDSIIYRMVPVYDTVVVNWTTTQTVHDTVLYTKKIFKVWKDTLITAHKDTLRHSLDTYTGKADWYGVQQAYAVNYIDTTHWNKPAAIVEFGFWDKLGLGGACLFIGAILGALALAVLIAMGKISLPKL